MATNTNIKAALSFGSNAFGIPTKTTGNSALGRAQAWFEATYHDELSAAGRGGAGESTADDLAAYLWRQISGPVKSYERHVAEIAVSQPSEFES